MNLGRGGGDPAGRFEHGECATIEIGRGGQVWSTRPARHTTLGLARGSGATRTGRAGKAGMGAALRRESSLAGVAR